MDQDLVNCNSSKNKPVVAPKGEIGGLMLPEQDVEDGDREEGEMNSLLSTQREGMSIRGINRAKSSRRKVQWNDTIGDKLVQVWEFQPSDSSDSDEEEDSDSCICVIM